MDRNWNRSGSGSTTTLSNNSSEKMYRQPYSNSSCGHQHQSNHYRKKNDYNSQEFYSKTAKPIVQAIKKDLLQISLVEDELNSANFSWVKNSGLN